MVAINYDWDELEDNIVEEYDDAEGPVAEYATEPDLYGNVINQRRNGVVSQYHFDAFGSTLALTDDNQQVTDTFAYNAFGQESERTGDNLNPFQFGGRLQYYTDSNVQVSVVRRRSLSTRNGRWLSVDPLLLADALNGYRYVSNRATVLVDPTGLQEDDIDIVCSCQDALDAFFRDRPAEARSCIGTLRRCNVHIFCAADCGPVGGLTFPEGGFVHICLPEVTLISRRIYFGLILHECIHAKQLIDANPRLCRREDAWAPGRRVPIPGLRGDITCQQCKDLEEPAYRAQALILFPNPPAGAPAGAADRVRRLRREFIDAGLCASCRHVCPEFSDPCPFPPLPLILLPPPPQLPIGPPYFEPLPIEDEIPIPEIPFPELPD